MRRSAHTLPNQLDNPRTIAAPPPSDRRTEATITAKSGNCICEPLRLHYTPTDSACIAKGHGSGAWIFETAADPFLSGARAVAARRLSLHRSLDDSAPNVAGFGSRCHLFQENRRGHSSLRRQIHSHPRNRSDER